MEPNERMKKLVKSAHTDITSTIPAIKYYRTGVEMARMAKIYQSEGNLEQAYVLYFRYITLFLEKIREHPDYPQVPDTVKSIAMKNMKEMFPKAEKLKGELMKRFQIEYEEWKIAQEKEREKEKIRKNKVSDQPSTTEWSFDSPVDVSTSNINRYSLRTIFIPISLIAEFLHLAKANTARNIETCALLTGTLHRDKLTVTVLLLPEQRGTADDCTAENDLATFNVIEAKNLITLGWIHTHPSQNVFLSSVDLHSQFGYQSMLPEAIAIVCAPKYSNEVLKLSDMGLDVIRNCTARGFHPHPGPSLFENANHAQFVDIPLETIDLRKGASW